MALTWKQDGKYKALLGISAAENHPEKNEREQHGDAFEDNPTQDDDDDNVPFGHEPKLEPVTIESVAALEIKIGPARVKKARKAMGMASDCGLTELSQDMLEDLARLYRSAV